MAALSLSFNEIGDGAPVIILHGLFGRRRNWQALQKRLADSARIVTADMRNHGDSPWDDSMAYTDMADDIAALIDNLGQGPAVVIGHSMGGKAAMTLALRDPDLVRSLMVIDIAPVVYDHEYQPYIDAMRHVPVAELGRRSEAESYMESLIPDPSIRSFLLQNLGQDERGLNWQVNLDAIENGISEILGFPDANGDPYEGPTKFLRGGKSDFVLDQHLPRIESLFPMATLDTVSGAGHWVHAEKPEDVISAIRTFTADAA